MAFHPSDRPRMEAGTRATLLFVEDNKCLLDLYIQEFSDDGYELIAAPGNTDALLELLDDREIDLVVLDMHLPILDGIELLGKLLSKDRKIPVVINSAYARFLENFVTGCADVCLVKSGDLSELKAAIRGLLGDRARSRKALDAEHNSSVQSESRKATDARVLLLNEYSLGRSPSVAPLLRYNEVGSPL